MYYYVTEFHFQNKEWILINSENNENYKNAYTI